jgi:hypothetical protein
VAATGLLGFNPYGKTQALDFSSKPTQLAIQLQQKEQAKAEAYEKYFMDYEKSINPAGLATGESKEFLNKYNKIKENWIKNKQAILNPAKYGYEAQSQYFADLKDAQMYIEQGKQASAERKAYNTYLDQARKAGKHIVGDLEVTANAMKPVGLGYEAPDTSKIEIFDPHDVVKYKDQLRNVTKNPDAVTTETLPNGITERTLTTFVPDLNELKGIAFGTIQKKGAKEFADQLLNDPSEVKRLSEVYNKTIGGKMPLTREAIFLAHTIEEAPSEIKPGGERPTQAYENMKFYRGEASKNARAAARQKVEAPSQPDVHIFDKIGSGGNPIVLPADKKGRTYKITNGVVQDEKGNVATITTTVPGSALKQDFFSVLKEAKLEPNNQYSIKAENGKITLITPVSKKGVVVGPPISRDYAEKEQALYYGTKKDLKGSKTAVKGSTGKKSGAAILN